MTVDAPAPVRIELLSDVAVATLDDGKANALSFDVIAGLKSALDTATEARRPLVVAGTDRSFCGGFDLAVMSSGDRAGISALLTNGAALYRAMCEAPIPVVVACTGHALAGGALLLLSADYRIGRSGDFKIGLNEVRLGIPLPKFAVCLVRHRLDPRCEAAALFAEVATPERAVQIGYLDEVVADPLAAAVDFATEAGKLPAKVFALSKARLRARMLTEIAELGM
jgi:enoyl-CoA hydratase